MDQDRLGSFLGSLCLHLGAIALVLLWPAAEPALRDLTPGHVVLGTVTIGKEGKLNPKAKKAEPREAESPNKPTAENKPTEEAPVVKPVENKTVEPEQKLEHKPVERKEPVVDPNAIAIPKDEKKKPPTKNATATAPPTKNATKTPPTKNATATAKPAKDAGKAKPKEGLNDILKEFKQADSGKKGSGKGGVKGGKGTSSSLSQSLSDLGNEVGGSGDDDFGNGPGGRGGDGVGALGAYEDSVVSRVKPNWQWTGRADRKSFTAEVYIRISLTGEIMDVRLKRSSGNPMFDSSVINAVKATANLEPPPREDMQEMTVYFSPDMLGK